MASELTRREMFKVSGAALGGAALAGAMTGCSGSSFIPEAKGQEPGPDPTKMNSLIAGLPPYYPGTEALGPNEMRITFLGTSCIPRLAQECNSVFVETGSGDNIIFDCGTGVVAKYQAMGIGFAKMNKIFLTHLHGDHMSDLTHIYCFGPSTERKNPLYVFGPSKSNVPDPDTGVIYEDGLNAFCQSFRDFCRWHTESFSFGVTRAKFPNWTLPTQDDWGLPVNPTAIPGDNAEDGYALVPIELPWENYGLVPGDNQAYYNKDTKVRITHFPAIHCRKGSISYKLEWNSLSMIFSGDTKPNYFMIDHAGGVDVLIHEMVVPAEVWAMKNLGITDPSQVEAGTWNAAFNYAKAVQNSSHTPQGAFGYILSQINPSPRQVVATHFQATDDTIASAMTSIRNHYPRGPVTIAADLMVLNVTPGNITIRRAEVSDWAWYPRATLYPISYPPKYHDGNNQPDPTAQLDPTGAVPQTDPNTGIANWDPNGY
ncbi:MAG: MBL fold metallo-hydrolase [Thermodesulfobacteriota bacterium]